MMLRELFRTQAGLITPQKFKQNEIARRTQLLDLSTYHDIANVHTGVVNSLDIELAEHRYLLAGCSDGSIYIHDLHNFSGFPHYTARCVCKVNKYSEVAHKCSVECANWFGEENELFITSGTDQILKIWDANNMKPVESFYCNGRIYYHECTAVPSMNPILAVASSIKNIELIDLRTGSAMHELRGHSSSVLACAWSPADEHLLATSGLDNKILFWDVRSSGSHLRSLRRTNDGDPNETAHVGYVNGLKFTSDGLHLVSAGTDHTLRLWDTRSGKNLEINYESVTNDMKRHLDLAICNTNPPIIFVPSEGYIYIMEMFTGKIKRILHGHFNEVNCIHYRNPHQELYTGGKDRNILIWTPDNTKLETYDAEEIKYELQIISPLSDSDSMGSD